MVGEKVPREPAWLWEHYNRGGTDPGGKVTLLWEGQHLAIIHTGGSMGWAGQGRQSYSRSRTEVIYKDQRRYAMGDYWKLRNRIPPLEGRTKKADVQAMIEKAKALDAEEVAAHG